MIPWRPIAELPDGLKDGRDVLLWSTFGAASCKWNSGVRDWCFTQNGLTVWGVTHFAEITPP